MSMHAGHDPAPGNGPGYEVRDVNIRALLQFAFWMAVLLAVTLVAMRFTFNYLSELTPRGPAASPFNDARQIPSGPLLQAQPHQELTGFCAGQEAAVTGYAWINQAGGIVQIPIDRAMDLTLQRGLPARPASALAQNGAEIPQVGAAGEPDATYLQGPCGYLQPPATPEAKE